MEHSDEDWKQKLTPEQYHVLRQKGTEAPFSGKLLENKQSGEYRCAGCGSLIFKSQAKYKSNTSGLSGWPSFSEVANSEAVDLKPDSSWSMERTEVICKKCGGHLGHLFDDDDSPSGKHYCINSCAMNFEAQDS